MNRPELLTRLTAALGNADLYRPVRAALDLIESRSQVEIEHRPDGDGQLRTEVLGSYVIRQKINLSNSAEVQGIPESIACLGKQTAERLQLITARVGARV